MPRYYRRSYRKSRGRRNRYPRRGTGSVDYIKMAKAAYDGVGYLKTLVNVEKHSHDINGSGNVDNSTGQIILLNGVAIGDDNSTRTGSSILAKSFNTNLKLTFNNSASNTAIRLVIVMDTQSNGSTPIWTDVFTGGGTTANYVHDDSVRFKVLYDSIVQLSSSRPEISKRIYRKLGMHIYYDGVGSTAATIVKNALWLFMFSDEATNTPAFTYRSQFLFIDN